MLLESVPGSDVVSVGLWFPTGSRDEDPGQEGFSHFVEHMLFKGTDRLSAFDIACDIDRVGGSINAFTEREVTSVYTSVPKEYFQHVFEIMHDICFFSVFPEEEILREQSVVLNEISASEDSPEETAFDEFLALYWQNNAIAKPIMGSRQSVKKIKRAAILEFYKKHYNIGNCIISIAGDFKIEFIVSYIEKIIKQTGQRSVLYSAAEQRIIPEESRFTRYMEGTFSQTHVYIGSQFEKPAALKDYYSLLLFSSAFGESMSSRLFQEVREKQGLCYSISSFRNYYSDIGFWMIYANTMSENSEKLLRSIEHEIKNLALHPVSQKELDDAIMQVKGTMILSKQDMEARMKRMARQYIAMGKVLSYEDCFSIIEDISLRDIELVADAIFKTGPLSILGYGGKGLKKLSKCSFSMEP